MLNIFKCTFFLMGWITLPNLLKSFHFTQRILKLTEIRYKSFCVPSMHGGHDHKHVMGRSELKADDISTISEVGSVGK